jgi:hypothetical protein
LSIGAGGVSRHHRNVEYLRRTAVEIRSLAGGRLRIDARQPMTRGDPMGKLAVIGVSGREGAAVKAK